MDRFPETRTPLIGQDEEPGIRKRALLQDLFCVKARYKCSVVLYSIDVNRLRCFIGLLEILDCTLSTILHSILFRQRPFASVGATDRRASNQ